MAIAASWPIRGRSDADYRRFLARDALKDKRIGVMRKKYTGFNALNAPTYELFEQARAVFQRLSAEIVDPADPEPPIDVSDDELDSFLFERKDGLHRCLATRSGVPVHMLADVIAFHEAHAAKQMPWFGQEFLVRAQARGPLTEEA